LTISNTSSLEVVAGFAEANAVKLAAGQPATISLSALPSTSVPGKVTAVSPVSTVVSNVVTYDVTVSLTNPPSDVKPGMTANVSVIVASADNVLELPTSAITTTGRFSTVTVLKNGKQSTQTVTTGLAGDTNTQIMSGLSAGEVVVEPSVGVGTGGTGATGTGTGAGGLGGGGGLFGGGGGGTFGGGGGGAFTRGG
jgi:macrolide-specific efflux system membrane fusion protein